MNENRDGDQVSGSYQYVDPNGSLIIVTYTAGAMGYSETREVREGFVEIRPRPQKQQGSSSFSGSSGSSGQSSSSQTTSSFNTNDIVSAVVSQVQPLISQTVSSAVSGSSRRPAAVPQNLPTPASSSFSSNDIVSQVVAEISPLLSQTVNSAVSGSSRSSTSRSSNTGATTASRQVATSAPVSSNEGSVTDLFGTGGDFNVRFNTPSFVIEY